MDNIIGRNVLFILSVVTVIHGTILPLLGGLSESMKDMQSTSVGAGFNIFDSNLKLDGGINLTPNKNGNKNTAGLSGGTQAGGNTTVYQNFITSKGQPGIHVKQSRENQIPLAYIRKFPEPTSTRIHLKPPGSSINVIKFPLKCSECSN